MSEKDAGPLVVVVGGGLFYLLPHPQVPIHRRGGAVMARTASLGPMCDVPVLSEGQQS